MTVLDKLFIRLKSIKRQYFLLLLFTPIVALVFVAFLIIRISALGSIVFDFYEDTDYVYAEVYSSDMSDTVEELYVSINGSPYQFIDGGDLVGGAYGTDTAVVAFPKSNFDPGTNIIEIEAHDGNAQVYGDGYNYEGPTDYLVVNLYDNTTEVYVDVYSYDSLYLVDLVEWRANGGAWNTLSLAGGTYGVSTAVYGYINGAELPSDYVDIEVRAFDNYGGEWPEGFYAYLQFYNGSGGGDGGDGDGGGDYIQFDFTPTGNDLNVDIYSWEGTLNIDRAEYRVSNQSGWYPISFFAGTFTSTTIDSSDIFFTGSPVTLEFRVIDDNGSEWTDTTTLNGMKDPTKVIFSEGFNDNVPTTYLDDDPDLSDSIGSEWSFATAEGGAGAVGRLRIQDSGFELEGAGAATFDTSTNFGGYSISELVLTQDLSNYTSASDLELRFDFASHDTTLDGSKAYQVFVRESDSDSWLFAADLRNDTPQLLGEYVQVRIDLDQLMSSDPTSTFQVRFVEEGSLEATAIDSGEGFSIDNLVLYGTENAVEDLTNPEISFTQTPGELVGGVDLNVAGTASDDVARIENVYAEGAFGTINAVPTDGLFNETSEEFTLVIDAFSTETYSFTVYVVNEAGLSEDYAFSGDVDSEAPTFLVSNMGQQAIDQAETTIVYTGTTTDNLVPIASVEYLIYDEVNPYSFQPATPIDGAFDEITEEFTFTISDPLPDKRVWFDLRVTDELGNTTTENFDSVIIESVDSSDPVIQLYQIIPNPTVDSRPYLSGKVRDDLLEKTTPIAELYYRIDGGAWVPITPIEGTLGSDIEVKFQVRLPELGLGTFVAEVRAVDDAGNDTDSMTGNQSVTYTVIAPDPGEDSINLRKIQSFDNHDDHDIIGSDLIWGGGVLRLPEEFNISRTPVITGGFGPNYGFFQNHLDLTPSASNGFWVSKVDGYFSYYNNGTATETVFAGTDFGLPPNYHAREIEEFYVGGQYHVWVAMDLWLLGINFGSSITDGTGDTFTVFTTGQVGTGMVRIDKRFGSNYGIYYNYVGGIGYLDPNDISNPFDDQFVTWTNFDGVSVDNTVASYIDTTNNDIWWGDYEDGIQLINDNGTPLNKADDNNMLIDGTDGPFGATFVIGKDKAGRLFTAGNYGLQIRMSNGGTPYNPNDEVFTNIITSQELGFSGVAHVAYVPGTGAIGGQFFISNRVGYIAYVSINDTPTDRLDDQVILIDAIGGEYPAYATEMYMLNSDTLRVVIGRRGVYDIDLNRDFAASGSALTKIDADIEGRLDVDFITLNSVQVIINAGTLSYEVSNDNGETWLPITVGETVNFPDSDYRIIFKINMTRGSTPVIGSVDLSYSAYVDPGERGEEVDIANEPPEVTIGSEFGFLVELQDDLGNPLEEDKVVNLELRRVSDNSVVDSFNQSSALVQDGMIEIDNASADVLGAHYIYAYTDEADTYSNVINFVEPSSGGDGGGTVNNPTLSLIADKYVVEAGDEVILSWTSSNLTQLNLKSQFEDFGFVNPNDTKTVVINEETTFTLFGSGPNGDLTATATILVQGDIDPGGEGEPPVDEKPTILVFEVTYEEVDGRLKVTIVWEVIGADRVDIIGVGEDLPLSGSIELFIDETTEFTIIAYDLDGEGEQVTESVKVEFILQSQVSAQRTSESIVPLVLVTGVTTLTSLITTTFASGGGIANVVSSIGTRFGVLFGIVVPGKKKYWGMVFDIRKSKGIPFAIVRLLDGEKVITQTVSDIDGKYGLTVEKPGHYAIEVLSDGYNPYKESINLTKIGESVEVVKDVPLSRVGEAPNAIESIRYYNKAEFTNFVKYVLLALMFIGFGYSLYVTLQFPVIVNFIILLVYFISFVLNLISIIRANQFKLGKVVDFISKSGIPSVSIRIYEEARQIGVYLTNHEGIAKINLNPGKYWYIVYKKGYEAIVGEDEKDASGKPKRFLTITEGGYLENDIELKKVKAEEGSLTKLEEEGYKTETIQLENPFGS